MFVPNQQPYITQTRKGRERFSEAKTTFNKANKLQKVAFEERFEVSGK